MTRRDLSRPGGGTRHPEPAALGRAPLVLIGPAVVGVAFLTAPLLALVLRSPWRSLPGLLASPLVLDALTLSLGVAAVTTMLCLTAGLPLAWVLARTDLPGRSWLRALVSVPLVLPPVVAGVALLAAFGRRGLLGGPLFEATGLRLPYTTTAVVVAHTFVALPFFVLSAEGALRASDREYDVVAATLGAGRWVTFRTVTVPLVLPGIGAGMLLAWARSLGEFGATITFAGNYPGVTQTMPLLVYQELQRDPPTAYALSLLLLIVSVLVLALLRERWLTSGTR